MAAASCRHVRCYSVLLASRAKINYLANKRLPLLTDCLRQFSFSNMYEPHTGKEKIVKLLYTAGETLDTTKVGIPDCIKELQAKPSKIYLK